MTPGQIILSVVSVALVGVLYFFGPSKPTQKNAEQPTANRDKPAAAAEEHSHFDFIEYRIAAIASLPAAVQDSVKQNDAVIAAATDADKIALLQKQKEFFIKNGIPLVAAANMLQVAEIENTEDSWTKAGHIYMAVSMGEENDELLAQYAVNEAAACYQKASDLNPEDLDLKINLASAYMQGGEQVMQGVQLLLGIIEKHPDHIPANLILGRYGIISGQYDKAVVRLEKVVKLDPKNSEALFYLAEAYNALGRKDDAVKTFEQCKKLVNDPGFSAEIDQYIEKIKNS
jgi:tetratricopeptide (TPR) repeat protein